MRSSRKDVSSKSATDPSHATPRLGRCAGLLIVGHTDSVGSDTYNHGLSVRRAEAALNYLMAQGVSVQRMHASGRGEWEPLATNETAAGRQANRRVEVAIFAGEGAVASR